MHKQASAAQKGASETAFSTPASSSARSTSSGFSLPEQCMRASMIIPKGRTAFSDQLTYIFSRDFTCLTISAAFLPAKNAWSEL